MCKVSYNEKSSIQIGYDESQGRQQRYLLMHTIDEQQSGPLCSLRGLVMDF